MFDRSNPAHLASYRAEVYDNPSDYPQDVRGTPLTASAVDNMNEVAKNRVPEKVTRKIDDVTVAEVAGIIDDAEYDGLTAYGRAWVVMFIGQPPGESVRRFKQKFLALFDGDSTTRSSAIALLPRDASRAEGMYGAGTKLNKQDWQAAARGSG